MVSMISHSVFLFWWFVTLKTTSVSSSMCPSRDVYDPTVESSPVVPNVTTPTELWPYPYLVSLIEQHSITKLYRHLCGGVIVNLKVVLTACSCLGEMVNGKTTVRNRCKRVMVLAGTPDIYLNNSVHRQLRVPHRCNLHPRCDLTQNVTVDIALVFLRENLTLTTHTEPMKVFSMNRDKFLHKLRDLRHLGTVCFQPSWSSNTIYYGAQPKFPGWIHQMKSQLISDDNCRELHCIFEEEGPACRSNLGTAFCATTFQGNPPTLSETGGPLLCHGIIFGITSIPSCDPCVPAVYVGPTAWLEHIKEFMPEIQEPLDCAPSLPIGFLLRTSLIAVLLHELL